MLSGIFSPLELNVGIVCMCMPAFRRFVARFLPSCFGSTTGSSDPKYKYRDYNEDGTPNSRFSSGKRSGGRRAKMDTLGGSLFQSTIVKTIDTTVEETKSQDDGIRLVEIREGNEPKTDGSSVDEISKAESLYKAQHRNTLPKDW
jgi:hypothetical protein